MSQGEHFIKELYSGLQSGAIYTYELPSKKSTWYGTEDIDKLISDVRNKNEGNVYIGLCPSSTIKTSYQRASRADVCALPAIVVDIDIQNGDAHAQSKLPATTREAMEWVDGLELPSPSAIIHTGNGLHVYWLLDTPFIINSEEGRKKAENLSFGINRLIISEGKKKGWTFDNIGDLARIVRAPLTFNHKSVPPKPVEVLGLTGQRFGFDELMSFVKIEGIQEVESGSFEEFDKSGKTSNTKPEFASIRAGCSFVRHCAEHADSLPEPSWYRLLTIVARCKEGTEICHQISIKHPKYSKEETDNKVGQALSASGPATCEYIAENLGFEGCTVCPLYHAKKLKSPISLGFESEALAKLIGSYAYCITTSQFCEVVA